MKKKIIVIILLILVAVGIIGACVCYSHQREKEKQEEKLEQEPYFTEFELSKYEMNILHKRFSVESTPTWRGWYDDSKLDMEDWPDYSYYKIEATDDTGIVVAVMNYWLFDERSERNQEGWEKAEEYGLTTDNRLTVEWVMEHPKEAIEIQSAMSFHGEDFDDWDKVSKAYEKIQNEGSPNEESGNEKEQEAEVLEPQTPFAEHGKLSVKGTMLCDSQGNPFQLKGVSTLGIVWFPQFVNQEAFQTIESWGGNVIRLAVYTEEYDGYLSGGDKEYQKNLIDTGVQAATDLGMYVIIDWHILNDGNPNIHKEEAKVFFQEMTAKYADYDNVLYEICNEPNGNVSWEEIKSYAEEVIPVIRANAPEAIIIVGTPTWSQDVDVAAGNPLQGENLMYACHFYAATHKQELRDKVQTALDAGIPIFISEYSICDSSGNGAVDYEEAEKWAQFIDEKQLSYVQWNLANKGETSSLIRTDCQKVSGWEDSDLTETGLWLKERLGK